MSFGENLKKLRKDRGLTLCQACKAMYIPSSSLSGWENNLNEPTLSNLVKLSKFYKVSISYMVGNQK